MKIYILYFLGEKNVYYMIFTKSLFRLFRIYSSQFSQSICATILVSKSQNEQFYLWTLWCGQCRFSAFDREGDRIQLIFSIIARHRVRFVSTIKKSIKQVLVLVTLD